MSNKPKDPCKVIACKIQSCLRENHFQESACLKVLEEMRQCCLKWHEISLCCSGIDLKKNYLELDKERKNAEKTANVN